MNAAIARPAQPSAFAEFRNRNFTLLWSGQLISTIGSALTYLAAGILIYRLTGSALSVGLMMLVTALPGLLVGFFAVCSSIGATAKYAREGLARLHLSENAISGLCEGEAATQARYKILGGTPKGHPALQTSHMWLDHVTCVIKMPPASSRSACR